MIPDFSGKTGIEQEVKEKSIYAVLLFKEKGITRDWEQHHHRQNFEDSDAHDGVIPYLFSAFFNIKCSVNGFFKEW